jgi:2-polyprenyl-6-methoxyphenol hydroxylase-like FAD-dependent oxidoreductase
MVAAPTNSSRSIMQPTRILVSGSGIAGLTLAIELKRHGFEPLVIEREPALRSEGYMMDFFGTGWDVAERMGLIDDLHAVRYPIEALDFVAADGTAYVHMPIARLRQALDNRYVYLRRQDLERILAERARAEGIAPRYGVSLAALEDRGETVRARFDDGGAEDFALVVGADGVHSRVRALAFGPESQFARFLGLYVAAFHVGSDRFPVRDAAVIYEEPDRSAFFYSLDRDTMDATYVFRHAPEQVPKPEQLKVLRERYRGAGWIAEDVLRAHAGDDPLYFDSVTQIVMPQWHRGRVALIGDACGCLTLLAGQGSHMAMAGGYVLAQELARQDSHAAAFAAYQSLLKPHIERKQKDAARFARLFVPSERSRPWLRRLTLRLLFSRALIGYGMALFGVKSVLRGWR